MVQLMPLPLTVAPVKLIDWFYLSGITHLGSPGQTAVKRVCVHDAQYNHWYCNEAVTHLLLRMSSIAHPANASAMS